MGDKLLSGLVVIAITMFVGITAGMAPAGAAQPKPGFAITGVGHVASGNGADAALVYDAQGRRHLLTVDMVHGRPRYTYRVRLRGSQSSQRVPIPTSGPKPRVFETLSADGIHVYAAVVACNGIWTAEGRVNKHRLSRFGRAFPGTTTCSAARFRAMLNAVVPLPSGRLALLASPASGADSSPFLDATFTQVYFGTPGGRLQLAANQPQQVYDGTLAGNTALALDSSTGQLVFVRIVPMNDQEAVYVQVGTPDGGWSTPVLAGRTSAAYSALSVSAAAARIAIAVSRHADSVTPITASPLPGFQLIEGTEAGMWQSPDAPPYTDNADVQAKVGLSGNGRLSIAFGRCTGVPHHNRAPGVVYTQARSSSGLWSQPRKRSTKHRIELDWVLPGRQIVGYRSFSDDAPGRFHGACA